MEKADSKMHTNGRGASAGNGALAPNLSSGPSSTAFFSLTGNQRNEPFSWRDAVGDIDYRGRDGGWC